MATITPDEKTKAKKGPKVDFAGPLTRIAGMAPTRTPWDGAKGDALKKPVVEDKIYLVDLETLSTDLDRNGRFELDDTSMAGDIITAGGILEPLTVNVPEGTTLGDLQSGKIKGMVLRGNRRTIGATRLRETDTASYEAFLAGRIPVKFVHATGVQEMAYRHDQGSQRGLSDAEIAKQVMDLLKQSVSRPEIQDIMYGSFYATSTDRKGADEAQADYEMGKCSLDELTQRRRRWAYGRFQKAERLAKVPAPVFKHFVYQEHPKLAKKDGYVVKAILSGQNIQEIYSIALDKVKGGKDKALERFYEIINKKAADRASGGAGNDTSDDKVGKSLSKQEIEKLVEMYDSEILSEVLSGIAGNKEARKRLPEFDAVLYSFEVARKAAPALVNALLTDVAKVLELTKGITF